ncbi:uncharacterized, partial [Tachysurus ichikawai]
ASLTNVRSDAFTTQLQPPVTEMESQMIVMNFKNLAPDQCGMQTVVQETLCGELDPSVGPLNLPFSPECCKWDITSPRWPLRGNTVLIWTLTPEEVQCLFLVTQNRDREQRPQELRTPLP